MIQLQKSPTRYLKYLLTIITLWQLLILGKVFAVPAAPSPYCQIKAEIISVDSVVPEQPSVFGGTSPAYLPLEIKTIKIVKQLHSEGLENCDQIYSVNKTISVIATTDIVKTNYSSGNIISATIHFGGDERMHGIFISDITTVTSPVLPNLADNSILSYILISAIILAIIIVISWIRKRNKDFKKPHNKGKSEI